MLLCIYTFVTLYVFAMELNVRERERERDIYRTKNVIFYDLERRRTFREVESYNFNTPVQNFQLNVPSTSLYDIYFSISIFKICAHILFTIAV